MKQKPQPYFNNQLARIRRTKRMSQKKVARLLGHNSNDQISRYERGVLIPHLGTALKLAVIYDVPVRVLLDGYFEACRRQVATENQLDGTQLTNPSDAGDEKDEEFCTFEERLRRGEVDADDLVEIGRHSTRLIRQRAERMGHI